MSHKCNKFLIKNGKFIRNFNKMYRHYNDPWDQKRLHKDDLLNNVSFYFLSRIIREEKVKVKEILDIGCANGYYSANLLALSSRKARYTGTDISPIIIHKAEKNNTLKNRVKFIVDDIRKLNKNFIFQFDLIFSAKTLYYVAPEIDGALQNMQSYLRKRGLLCFTYNQSPGAFSNKWLTYKKLREKLISRGLREKLFIEINRFMPHSFAVGIYQINHKNRT